MAIHEYLLPNEAARPRRVAITPDDVLYYSDYGRGYLGQFDTKTGKLVKEWPSPGGPQSRPYGITIVNGIVWYSESGVKPNTLVRFDPKTEKFQTWAIPGRRRRRAEHDALRGRQAGAHGKRRKCGRARHREGRRQDSDGNEVRAKAFHHREHRGHRENQERLLSSLAFSVPSVFSVLNLLFFYCRVTSHFFCASSAARWLAADPAR